MPNEILEATDEQLVYKFYADGSIDATAEPDPTSDPGVGSAQVLRYVSHNLSMARDSYATDEVRTDQIRPMSKLGTKRVPATLNCLLSAGTYQDFFEAALRGTWSGSAVSASEADFTSLAATAADSTLTLASGNPVTKGFRIGDPIVLSGCSVAANNRRFVIIGFSTANNRIVHVYPAPADQSADTAFGMTSVGRNCIAPISSQAKRKVAVEVYNSDGDISRLYTEGRIAGFELSIAPNQNATINWSTYFRNRIVADSSDAPFFTSPTAETTSEVVSSMDGLLMKDGEVLGITTGLNISFQRAPQAPAQLNRQSLTAGIVLANAVVTGQFTVFLIDPTFMSAFDNEEEMELLVWLPDNAGGTAEAVSLYLPRIKIMGNTEVLVEGSKALQCNYEASRYDGARPGAEVTVLRVCDTLVA